MGTGAVCTSNPLIDPASIFATGILHLSYVQETRHIYSAVCGLFFVSFFYSCVKVLSCFLFGGESLLPCAPRVGTMN